jgi:hypothetical protein
MKAVLLWAATSPRWRATIMIIGGVIISVVSGFYATQIASGGVIAWSSLTKVSSFWPLVVATAIWVGINVLFLSADHAILRFADDEHCLAFVRYTNLEAYARIVKSDPTKTRDARELLKELMVKKK